MPKPAPRRQKDRDREDMEVRLGGSLAETERVNRPEHRAGEQARDAVRRQSASAGRGRRRRKAFRIAVLILLAVIGLVGWLVSRAG